MGLLVFLMHAGADGRQRLTGDGSEDVTAAVDGFDMMKTIVIAVCCAVAYLAIVVGLTVYCSIRLIRAKNLRKHGQNQAVLRGRCTQRLSIAFNSVPAGHRKSWEIIGHGKSPRKLIK